MELERSSGLLLHPTSLPGPGGVGTLGQSARRFVDRLAESGQQWWQILPLNPPGHGGSPYSATSAFAGNVMLLDPDPLVQQGWLDDGDVSAFEQKCEKFPDRRFVIDQVVPEKSRLLKQGASNWLDDGGREDADFQAFCRRHGEQWLDDFALFTTLQHLHGDRWRRWPDELVRREPSALQAVRDERRRMIDTVKFLQWQFFRQWRDLRNYADDRGVRFFGDIPIFVAMNSAEVWARRELFELDADGDPEAVAGVPPDYFSETGQKWGNPLYDWDRLARDDYRWWVDRVGAVLETVDLVRVDHFRGFEAYWRVPADAETAVDGEWIDGPKDEIFEAIRRRLGVVPFVAEDLGTITDEVYELRDRQGLPGMKVLQFGFDGNPDHPFLPHTYPERAVAYTGTHDNDTTQGWYDGLDEEQKHRVRVYFSHPDEGIVDAMIEGLWESDAKMTIVPVQDLFGLGSDHRMNTPGEAEGNWRWRMTAGELIDDEVFERLRGLTERTGRGDGDGADRDQA